MKNTEEHIIDVCNELAEFLIEKNKSYGDSAVRPKRIFTRHDITAEDLINCRIDDKLSRLMSGDPNTLYARLENTEDDLLGYLILKRVAKRVREEDLAKVKAAGEALAPAHHPTDMEIVTGATKAFGGQREVPVGVKVSPNSARTEVGGEMQCVAVSDANHRCDLPDGHDGPHENHAAKMQWNRRT